MGIREIDRVEVDGEVRSSYYVGGNLTVHLTCLFSNNVSFADVIYETILARLRSEKPVEKTQHM